MGKFHLVLSIAWIAIASTIAKHHKQLPVVIWHGMGDTCCDPKTIGKIEGLIKETSPSTFVYSISIGKDASEDRKAGFFGNVNEQVAEVCQQLSKIKELSKGFNAVGFSQGGLFLRAYIERCNSPPVKNLVTMGSPHAGISDPPGCDTTPDSWRCNLMRAIIRGGAYTRGIRDRIIQAQYIKDPKKIQDYLEYNIFLPDINNEKEAKNSSYSRNLSSLKSLTLVRFSEDHTLLPKDSSWFSFFEDGTNELVPLQEQRLYKEDWIGLKKLDDKQRLHFLTCPGEHMQFTKEYFISEIIPILVPKKTHQEQTSMSYHRQGVFKLQNRNQT